SVMARRSDTSMTRMSSPSLSDAARAATLASAMESAVAVKWSAFHMLKGWVNLGSWSLLARWCAISGDLPDSAVSTTCAEGPEGTEGTAKLRSTTVLVYRSTTAGTYRVL